MDGASVAFGCAADPIRSPSLNLHPVPGRPLFSGDGAGNGLKKTAFSRHNVAVFTLD
jgi:hypothetical protein